MNGVRGQAHSAEFPHEVRDHRTLSTVAVQGYTGGLTKLLIVQPGCTKPKSYQVERGSVTVCFASSKAKEGFKGEVERRLTGKETEPWEIIYFKLYKSQLPVVENAI